MTRKEELLDQYEDAVFALLLDRVAQAEGNWAFRENTRLKEDPGAAVPEALQRRCRDIIHREFAPKAQKQRPGFPWKILYHAAVIVLLLAATVTVAVAAFPELRANFLNTILDIQETYTDFSFEEAAPAPPELQIEAGWLPEGFDLVQDGSISDSSWQYYENTSNDAILIKKSYPTTLFVDTEDAEIVSYTIQGYEGTLITKSEEARLVWLDTDKQIIWHVSTEGLPADAMLKIAENVS